jgi:hypothetical protein
VIVVTNAEQPVWIGMHDPSNGKKWARDWSVPFKLICQGGTRASLAASAITRRSRLYANKCIQNSLRTRWGVLHRKWSICSTTFRLRK